MASPDPDEPSKMHDNSPQGGDFTLIGVLLFAGLMIGASIGGFIFYAPVPGALIGASIGLGYALFSHWKQSR
ncbi:hypothetical protein JCM17844_05820 [Iodidimonas gelatinilytica]|uniref:Uncharacterized protein n=1 Tax=Iodidimonas gelatinilytica TaxID=1236966 RepID=A0A5A7MXC6_9PROT|nr:hypothetical protein [Iodidimonas gelatinilytica]GEQ96945.1 hypothetical protein JCM17844_05820 [Iodidimonas gelatinilytica]GER00507.1 hypothetical protein JCM17845_11300 [Iodidimonas gelatinilytica]